MPEETVPFLRVGTGWIELEVISQPDVYLTFKGYVPFVYVRNVRTGLEYGLYISAKSVSEPLEELRKNNNRRFEGIRMRIRKESMDRMSKYELEELN